MWRELTAPYAADAGLRRLEQRYAVEPAQLAADFSRSPAGASRPNGSSTSNRCLPRGRAPAVAGEAAGR
jgi:hypothetical protein